MPLLHHLVLENAADVKTPSKKKPSPVTSKITAHWTSTSGSVRLLLESPPVSPSTVQTFPAVLTSEHCSSLEPLQEVASLPFCVKNWCPSHHVNTVKEIHIHMHQAPRTSAMLCIKKLSPTQILICSCNCPLVTSTDRAPPLQQTDLPMLVLKCCPSWAAATEQLAQSA